MLKLARITHVIINLPFLNLIDCFSELCLVIHKSNFSNYKIVNNTSSIEIEQLNHKLHTE